MNLKKTMIRLAVFYIVAMVKELFVGLDERYEEPEDSERDKETHDIHPQGRP